MPTTRKNLTPKHVMLKHDPTGVLRSGATRSGVAPIDLPLSAYTRIRKRTPFSPGWLRTMVLGYHSPTWATALALSTMLLSDDLSRRINTHKAEQYSPQNQGRPNAEPAKATDPNPNFSSSNYSSRNS